MEIFCKEQYKNYYLRGVTSDLIADISDTIISEDLADTNPDIDPGIVYYKTTIFALVNDEYQKRAKENANKNYFHLFDGNTKKDFISSNLNRFIMQHPHHEECFQNICESCEKDSSVINLEDANIIENSYLNESIESKKDIILINIDISFNRIESTTYDLFKERYPKKNYPLLAYYFSKNAEPELPRFKDYELIYLFIFNLCETLYYCADYKYLDEKKYHKMLEAIGNICLEWLNQKKITKDYLNSLNSFKNCQTSDADPLTRFCNNFFYELIDDLNNQKMIKECEYCSDFFPINSKKKTKKYCSLKFEGKDCARVARNKKYYERHKEEIKPKARKLMKEQRECYKKYDIKK